jgi:hypothetical protein
MAFPASGSTEVAATVSAKLNFVDQEALLLGGSSLYPPVRLNPD